MARRLSSQTMWTMAATAAAALAALVAAPGRADAAVSAQLSLVPKKSTYAVNEPILVDVFVRSLADTNTAAPSSLTSIDLDFGGPTGSTTPLRFAAASGAPKAFVASSALLAKFGANVGGTVTSGYDGGSLLDGRSAAAGDLSYSPPQGSSAGFATNQGAAGDLFVGTIYALATQASPVGSPYVLSANNFNTFLNSDDANFDAFTLSFVNASITVVAAAPVPEPTTAAAILAGLTALAGRRRR